MAFNEHLRGAMELRDFSQGKLAVRTGLRQNHISMILSGKITPSIDVARKLAEALNVSLDWLCDLPPRTTNPLTPQEDELIKLYKKCEVIGTGKALMQTARALAEE